MGRPSGIAEELFGSKPEADLIEDDGTDPVDDEELKKKKKEARRKKLLKAAANW
jgi:hypothetical protein